MPRVTSSYLRRERSCLVPHHTDVDRQCVILNEVKNLTQQRPARKILRSAQDDITHRQLCGPLLGLGRDSGDARARRVLVLEPLGVEIRVFRPLRREQAGLEDGVHRAFG